MDFEVLLNLEYKINAQETHGTHIQVQTALECPDKKILRKPWNFRFSNCELFHIM